MQVFGKKQLVCLIALVISMAAAPLISQTQPQNKWTRGTIMEVKQHNPGTEDTSNTQWDVAVQVGRTIYVVLYTEPAGRFGVKYRAGMDLLVLVGEKTITFNDMLARRVEVPIISTKSADSRPPASSYQK